MAIIAVVLAAVLASGAGAEGRRPEPRGSAVMQYTELVPTAGGPAAPGVDEPTSTPLPPGAPSALDASSAAMAKMLAEVATSSDYGAPTSTAAPADPGTAIQGSQAGSDGTLRATAEAAIGVGDTRLIGLLAAMMLTLVAAATLAIGRRR